MGPEVEGDVPRFFATFTKCLRDWLEQRKLPVAWIYAHEYGRKVGLRTHMTLYVPGAPSDNNPDLQEIYNPDTAPDYRGEFRAWVKGWKDRQVGRPTPRAIRVSVRKKETPWLHWVTTSYLMKGYDRSAVVQAARNSPDGRAVMLGGLIACPWRDPGPVAMKQRVGASRSLGPDRRAIGVPAGFDYLLRKRKGTFSLTPGSVPHTITIVANPWPAFRSKYEDGIRDVRLLYPPEFYELITGLPSSSPPPPEHDESLSREIMKNLNLG